MNSWTYPLRPVLAWLVASVLTCAWPPAFGADLTNLHEFVGLECPEQNATFVLGPDGKFYGWTGDTGTNGQSVLWRVGKDGTGYELLHTFSLVGEEAESPNGLLYGSDGMLYGTANDQQSSGLIFELSTSGDNYQVLKHFDLATDGTRNPYGLIELTNGLLCGVSCPGCGSGELYTLAKGQTAIHTLHTFPAGVSDGRNATGLLLEGPDTKLYGITASDSPSYMGTVYRINPDGSGYEIIHQFTGNGQGAFPGNGLIYGSDGFLYGQAQLGGMDNAGGAFRLHLDGGDYQFIQGVHGTAQWYRGLVEGPDGNFYGATVDGGPLFSGTLFRFAPNASATETLHQFVANSTPIEGIRPKQLVSGNDGFLYFITFEQAPFTLRGVTAYRSFLMRYGPIGEGQTQPVLTSGLLSGGTSLQFQLSFTGAPFTTYGIEAALQLPPAWQPLTNVQADSNGLVRFSESVPPGPASRFYRIRGN